MSTADQVNILLEWCDTNFICIESTVRVYGDEQGEIGVFSVDDFIPANTTLVRIPKTSILSIRSCSLADVIPFNPYGVGAQLSCSLALYGEILLGNKSKWHGYLQSLPCGIVDLPVFWGLKMEKYDYIDGLEALSWLHGTEAGKILQRKAPNGDLTLEEIDHFFYDIAEPLLLQHRNVWSGSHQGRTPMLNEFYRAFSLVSSRAFLVDAYHGLSMVPIADAFNHVRENHVHLESDYNVCPECGSLEECPHDRDLEEPAHETRPISMTGTQDENHDLYCEMVSNAVIPPNSEIFNTYGEDLTNAQLLNQYGFVLDVNDNDRLCWTMDEILQIISPGVSTDGVYRCVAGVLSQISEDHPSHDISQLTYYERLATGGICLNDEGMVSHQLWTVLYVLALRRKFPLATEVDALENLPLVLDLLVSVELDNPMNDKEIQPENDDDEGEDDYPSTGLPVRAVPWQILLEIARQVVMLCRSRKESSGQAGCAGMVLSDVMEDIPVGRVRTVTAISVLIGERSILDCCEAAWAGLVRPLESSQRGMETPVPCSRWLLEDIPCIDGPERISSVRRSIGRNLRE